MFPCGSARLYPYPCLGLQARERKAMLIDQGNEEALNGMPGQALDRGDLEETKTPSTDGSVPPPGGSAAAYQQSADSSGLAYNDIL